MGEVGSALAILLDKSYDVWTKDIEAKELPARRVDVVHICLNYVGMGHDAFMRVSKEYIELLAPSYVDVCSTVPPGTTQELCSGYPVKGCHSTTRGLHPNLVTGLLKVKKHVGGPGAEELAREFAKVGIKCVVHASSKTTELAHVLNNAAYGASLMFADEMAKLCRDYGVDYYEAVMKYTETHNRGFEALDHARLVRPILTPPGGKIGGHCVIQSAKMIPDEKQGPILSMLAAYGKPNMKPHLAAATEALKDEGERARQVHEVPGDGSVQMGATGSAEGQPPAAQVGCGVGPC